MTEEILTKFYEILKTGTEEEIRNFITENFNEFPEDLQRAIVGTFFEEAVDISLGRLESLNKYLEELLSTHKELSSLKKVFEDRIKELELKREIEEM
mgnify:CR=1 FL=1